MFRRTVSLFALITLWMQPAVAVPGYRLHQSSEFYGDSTAEVTTKSIRMQSSKLGLTLHVAAPSFSMTAVNTQNRQYALLPMEQWQGFLHDRNPRGYAQNRMVKRGKTKIAGVEADEWWVNTGRRLPVVAKDAGPWLNGESYNTKYWVTKKISPPADTYGVFSAALGMPTELGYPLRMEQFTTNGRKFVTFDTHKIERCDVAEKLPIPAGFARTNNEMALLVGSGFQSEALSALLNDDDDDSAKKNPKATPGEARGWVPGMELTEADVSNNRQTYAGSWVPGD
jgi:hypothetical protein